MATRRSTLARSFKRLRHRLAGRAPGGAAPVFVLGDQRATTALVRDALDRHPLSECYSHEDHSAFREDASRALERIEPLVQRSRAERVVFEPRCEVHRTREILDRAGGRAVWICRNYEAVIHAALADVRAHYAYLRAMLHKPDLSGLRLAGVTSSNLELVRDAYDRGLNEASCRGLIWHVRSSLFFEEGLDRHDRARVFDFDALLEPDGAEMNRLLEFVGLPSDAGVLDFAQSVPRPPRQPRPIDPHIRDLCEATWARLRDAKRAAGSSEERVRARA